MAGSVNTAQDNDTAVKSMLVEQVEGKIGP